jgi:hypothetical protein
MMARLEIDIDANSGRRSGAELFWKDRYPSGAGALACDPALAGSCDG